MDQSLRWLPDAYGTVWGALGIAIQAGLPVPAGFIAFPSTSEDRIRSAYEELKIREKTHFVAVRGISHAMLNVIGPDQLMHSLHRLWMESPESLVLVQRMVHATWCGKAQWHRRNLRIKANEGMCRIVNDSTCFTIEIPSQGLGVYRMKNRCVLANTAAESNDRFLVRARKSTSNQIQPRAARQDRTPPIRAGRGSSCAPLWWCC